MKKIDKIQIEKYKSILNLSLEFNSKINIFIGPNNSGKSNILSCIFEAINSSKDSFTHITRLENYQKEKPKVNLLDDVGNKYIYKGNELKIFNKSNSRVSPYKEKSFVKSSFKAAIIDNRKSFEDLHLEMVDFINDLESDEEISRVLSGWNRDLKILSNGYLSVLPVKNKIMVSDEYGDTSRLDEKSSGIIKMTAMAFYLTKFGYQNEYTPHVILIDEPELHIHTEAQRYLFAEIQKRFSRSQLIISTHSPIFINSADLKNVFLVNRSAANGTYVDNNERQMNKISKINNIMGLNLLDTLRINPNADMILVEGKTEKLLHNYIYKRLYPSRQVEFFSIDGVNRINDFVSLMKEVFVHFPKGILDYDEQGKIAGRSIKNKFNKKYLDRFIFNNKKTVLEENFSAVKVDNQNVLELEDMFERDYIIDNLVKFLDLKENAEVKTEFEESNNFNSFVKKSNILKGLEFNKVNFANYIYEDLKSIKDDNEFKKLVNKFIEIYEVLNKK